MSATSRGRCDPTAGGMYAILILLLILVSGCKSQGDRNDIRRREVVQGGNITLTCYAEPGHLRTYRWVYIRSDTRRPQVLSAGRRLVIGEPRFNLVTKVEDDQVALQLQLSDVQFLDSGLFMCWRKGVRPDPQILLTVLEPGTTSERQVITQLTGPTELQYGESAVFTCNIKPAWPVKVTWLKNGAEIPLSARIYTQKVQRVAAEDGNGEILQATLTVDTVRSNKNFTCSIDTEPPEERSIHVTVRVARVDSLTAEPDKDTVEYGQSMKLTCVVSGTRSEIVWLKDGSEMIFGPSAPGREKVSTERSRDVTASTIYIDSVSFQDNGHYVCYIPGASKDILINIDGRPPRLLGVTGGNFFEDEPLTLRCSTQYVKHNQRAPVTWNFEGLPLDPSLYESRVEQSEYNVTVHELVIPVGRSHHSGNYECVTAFGSASIYVDLFVPPSLGEPLPSEVEVEEGQSVEVSCNAIGRPLPSIQWEKLVEDTWVVASDVEGVNAWPDGLLKIEGARLDHAGDYRCAARSEAGSFLAGMVLQVERIPAEVVEMMSPEDVMEGDNFTVLCTVANFIGPVDFWFNGVQLQTALQPRYSLETYLRDDGLMNVYLTVQEATLEDSGFYECHAGIDSSLTTDVMVQKRPWEVLELKASHAVLGQDFFLSCTVKDWPRKVTFYHNSKVINADEDARYTVHAPDSSDEEGSPLTHVMKVAQARLEDEGVYQCSLDGYSSSSVAVTVEEPREEVLEIYASAAVIGRDFNITCKVQHWENDVTFVHNNVVVEPEREWRYEVTKLPGERPELSSHVLTVTSASLDDSGYYECYTSPMAFDAVIVEVWREADVSLELQTLERPNWMDAPIPMNCKVAGVDPNKVTIMFLQDDIPRVAIQNKTKMSTSNDLVYITITEKPDAPESPETTFTLGFYSLSQNHSGFWSCEVLHPSGASLGKDVVFLEVADIPKFVVAPPEEVFEDVGEDLYLNCSTSGPSDTTVAWYRKGIPEPILSRSQSASLFIPGFTSTDEGEYYCLASAHDREIRAETVLKLRTPQPRVESVKASAGVEGEDLTITCTVSYWNGVVLFFINGEPAEPELSSRYSVHRQASTSEHAVSHILTVHNTRLEDAGVAECFINLEEFGSAVVEVEEADSVVPTRPATDDLDFEEPTLPPGRIIDLVGPALVEAGSTLTLTCLVSPVMQEVVVLTHDVFLLQVGDSRITNDPRVEIVSGTSKDGTRVIFLSIEQVRPEDSGEYRCDTSTKPPATAAWIVSVVPAGELAVTTTPAPTTVAPTVVTSQEEYDYEDLPPGINATLEKEEDETEGCTLPSHWEGEWLEAGRFDEFSVTRQMFGKGSCVSAMPGLNAFLLNFSRKRKACIRCLVFDEKHENFMVYRKSRCQSKQDAEALCESAKESSSEITIIRQEGSTICPFSGPRSFTFQRPFGVCDLEHSKLTSIDEDTTLFFRYNPCPKQTSPNVFPYPEKVSCIATWSEDNTQYLVGKLTGFRYGDPQYRCYIYEEKFNEKYLYSVTRTSSYCGARSPDYEYFYRIYNNSIAPGIPVIEGYDGTKELYLGAPLRLICRSSGGFPPAKLSWYKNGDEIPSESFETETGSENHLDVLVQEDDDGAEYRCDATNFADTLSTHVRLFLHPGSQSTTTAVPEPSSTTEVALTITTEATTEVTTTEATTEVTTTEATTEVTTTETTSEVTTTEAKTTEEPTTAATTTSTITTDAATTTTTMTTTTTPSTTTELFYEYYVDEIPPIVTAFPETPIGVPQGASLNLTCAAEGVPMPYVQWVKRDEDGRRAIISDRVLTETVLVLDGISDSEVYSCEAESESGFVSQEVEILVVGPPPPQNVRLRDLTETSVVVTWDLAEDAKFYTVFKNDSSSQGEAEDVFDYNYYNFTDLEPYTKYEFRVAVVTKSDQIALSESLLAITGDTAPETPVIKGFDSVLKFDVGEALALTCVSGGGLSPLIMKWYKDGVEVASAEHRSEVDLQLVLQEEDEGAEFLCQASNYVAMVNTSVVARIKEGVCKVPEQWAGEWYSGWDEVAVASDLWLDQDCLTSSKNRFLVKKEWRDCNTCYIVTEKHHNILEYRESQCEATTDLQALCSTIDTAQPPTHVMRMGGSTECPFIGLRSFTYRLRHRSCTDEPSRLSSENNDTELVFHYDPCADDTDLHIDVRSERIECVGTWSEGDTHFLMGKLESILGGEPRYRCFTFTEEQDEEHQYSVGRSSSEACGALGESTDSSYEIYGESVAPGMPIIIGYDPSDRVKIGTSLNLTCSSQGGFPHAKLTWFKEGEAVPSETQLQDDGRSVAVLEVTLEGMDNNETEYRCRAFNFVADFNTSVVIHVEPASLPSFENIMVPKVIAVEDETAFLPCIRTQEDEDIKMEWYDADIETQLTSGNQILTDDKSHLQPWNSNGFMGLMVLAGFVDTNYACNVNGRRVGNTTAVILARYLIGQGAHDNYDHFEDTIEHITIKEGSDTYLNCTVRSYSSSSYLVRWRRNPGYVLLTQNAISLAEDEGYTIDVVEDSYLLNVANADVRHAGLYFCQVIIDEVEVYTKNFSISIDDITQTYMGQDGYINCYAPPGGEEVKFIHEGKEILPSSTNETEKYAITVTEEQGQVLTGRTGTLYTLKVSNTSLEDEGLYECVAEDDLGELILREAVLLVDLEELGPFPTESSTTEFPTTPSITTTTTFIPFGWWDTTTTTAYPEETSTTTTTIPKFKITTTTEPTFFGESTTTSETSSTTTSYVDIVTTSGWTTTTSEPSPTDIDVWESEITTPTVTTEPSTTTTDEDTTTTTTTAATPTTTTTTPPTTTTPMIIVEPTEEPEEYSTIDSELYYTVEPKEEYSGEEIDYEIYDVSEEEKEEKEAEPTEAPVPHFAEVTLPCEGSEKLKIEDITWKTNDDLLFLGELDLAALPGLSLSPEGALILSAGPYGDIRDGKPYVCYGFDTNTFEDIPLVSYQVSLNGEDTIVEKLSQGRTDKQVITKPTPKPQPEPAAPDLEFGGLEGEELLVLANTERVGRRIVDVLKSGGLDVRFLNQLLCTSPDDTRSWLDAQEALEGCEDSARSSGLIGKDKNVFIGIDFYVEIAPSSWFAVTKLYINNMRKKVSVSVFAPMVPVPSGNVERSSEPGQPDAILVSESWWDSVQGAGNAYGNALAASILSLKESYQSRLQDTTDES